MTEPLEPASSPSDELQFENAEFTPTSPGLMTCAACANQVVGTYYEANGKVICDSCREKILAQRNQGSGLVRFVRAFVFGSFAAVGGYAIYFGVMKATGWEVGIISILVGLMVGSAVRAGSRHRGGWAYQLLALFLTYSAIVATYSSIAIPILFAQLSDKEEADKKEAEQFVAKLDKPGAGEKAAPRPPETAEGKEPEKAAAKPADAEATPKPATARENADPAAPTSKVAAREAVAPGKAAPLDAEDAESEDPPAPMKGNPGEVRPWMILIALVAGIGFLYSLPILIGFQSPISLLIASFALWEAWKLNRRVAIVFNGPYDAGTRSDSPATELENHG